MIGEWWGSGAKLPDCKSTVLKISCHYIHVFEIVRCHVLQPILVLSCLVFNRPRSKGWSHCGQAFSKHLCRWLSEVVDPFHIWSTKWCYWSRMSLVCGATPSCSRNGALYNVLLQTFTFFAHNMPKIAQFSSLNRFELTLFNSCCLRDPVIRFSRSPWNSEDLCQTRHFEGILFSSVPFKVQLSQPYITTGHTKAFSRRIFIATWISRVFSISIGS